MIDNKHGNCLQAVYASLFDLKLNDVLNLLKYIGIIDI